MNEPTPRGKSSGATREGECGGVVVIHMSKQMVKNNIER